MALQNARTKIPENILCQSPITKDWFLLQNVQCSNGVGGGALGRVTALQADGVIGIFH